METLNTLKGWSELSAATQQSVTEHDTAISEELRSEAKSRMSVGEHYVAIQKMLPGGMWDEYTRTRSVSRSTVYNYINSYLAAQQLPRFFYEKAVEMGIHAIDTEKLKEMPPPKVKSSTKVATIVTYLRAIEKRPGRKAGALHLVAVSPELLLKRAVHEAELAFDRLPGEDKLRQVWIESFMGMCMTHFGLSTPKTFAPVAVPDSFHVALGRPRQKKAAA